MRNRLIGPHALPTYLPLLLTAIFLFAIAALWLWLGRRASADFIPFEDFRTQMLDVGEWQIRYHQSGHGPPMLLLHGIGANLYCWRQLVPRINGRFTVTVIDLPGFGRSSKPAGARYGLDEQAERLRQILDTLKIERTYIVGNSMGGNIALWFAVKFPARVEGLALIAPATSTRLLPLPIEKLAWFSGPASLMLNRYAMKWVHGRTVSKTSLVDKDRVEETFFTYGRQPMAVRSFMLATAAIRDSRLLPSLTKIKTRILILWGSNDKLVNRRVIDELEAALPEAESHVHMGGGHHLQEDEPDWVSEKLTQFFPT